MTDTIKAIKDYIRRTKIPEETGHKYPFYPKEAIAVCDEAEGQTDAVFLAFEYGMAKGWRATKAEAKYG